jgi:hypothetical protein
MHATADTNLVINLHGAWRRVMRGVGRYVGRQKNPCVLNIYGSTIRALSEAQTHVP